MIDDINSEVQEATSEIFGRGEHVNKEDVNLINGLVTKRAYWSESFWKDMWFYFSNNDNLVSMACANKKNPFSTINRIIVFICVLSASMFLSVMLMKTHSTSKQNCCIIFSNITSDCLEYNEKCIDNLDIDLQNNDLIYSTIISVWDFVMDYIILWYYSCRLQNQLLFCCFKCQKNCCLVFNVLISLGFFIPSIMILYQQKILIERWIINFLIVFLSSYVYQGILTIIIIFPFKRWTEKKNAQNKRLPQTNPQTNIEMRAKNMSALNKI